MTSGMGEETSGASVGTCAAGSIASYESVRDNSGVSFQ